MTTGRVYESFVRSASRLSNKTGSLEHNHLCLYGRTRENETLGSIRQRATSRNFVGLSLVPNVVLKLHSCDQIRRHNCIPNPENLCTLSTTTRSSRVNEGGKREFRELLNPCISSTVVANHFQDPRFQQELIAQKPSLRRLETVVMVGAV